MKHTFVKTLKPTALAALLVFALPVSAWDAINGEQPTWNTPDGFAIGNGSTVISQDGKFVSGGSHHDIDAGGTLILASENAEIDAGGKWNVGGQILQGQDQALTNLSFKNGDMVVTGTTLNVTATMTYSPSNGQLNYNSGYLTVQNGGVLNVNRFVADSYYSLEASSNGTITVQEAEVAGMVKVDDGGTLNIGKSATIGHLWNMGTVDAADATIVISTSEDMLPRDYGGDPIFKHEDGKTYTFGNGINRQQTEDAKDSGTMTVGKLIVHGNALNADNSTLNATNIAVDEALKNEAGANINVTDGGVTARTIDGAEGNIKVTNSTVAVTETSDFGNVTANNSSVFVGAGNYTFNTFSGSDKSIIVNDLSANVSIATKEGALDLVATGTANDQYGNAQESVERIQEVLTVGAGDRAGDVYLLIPGVVNDGARIEFNDQGDPVITYLRNTNMENFGSLAALSIVNWRNELNSLSKRMGELRDSPAGIGTWVRLYGSENELGSITARNTTIQIGSDYSIGDWKVGVAVNYTDGDADFAAGSGDNQNYGIALYGTWLSESGQFVDLMAKYSRLDQDFQLSGMDGSYDNNAFALSVEYGWRFELGSLAFVEPQAAFTYSHIEGDSFKASGAEIEQDNYDSYIGRVGVRGGFKFPDNKGNIYARVSYLYDFDGEMNATARAVNGTGRNYIYEDLGGSWVEYGVGANFNLTDRTYTYVDLERNSGGEIKENWRWNVGLRHVF